MSAPKRLNEKQVRDLWALERVGDMPGCLEVDHKRARMDVVRLAKLCTKLLDGDDIDREMAERLIAEATEVRS